MTRRLLISFSGGRTSAMMTWWLLRQHFKAAWNNERNYHVGIDPSTGDEIEILVVFANTGHEREATLEFVNNCDLNFDFHTVWIEAVFSKGGTRSKIVDYRTAYRNYKKNGIDPFEMMIAKYGIPNMKNPHCSRELKKYAINAYMRSIGWKSKTYHTALGIRTDEPRRLNWERAKKELLTYFAQYGKITKDIVNSFWSKQAFDLLLKSFEGNCILCWKKSFRKLYTLIQQAIIENDIEVLAEIEWLKMIHEKYGRYIPETRKKQDKGQQVTMFRGNKIIADLLEDSDGFVDFAIDESKLILTAVQLSQWDEELDGNFGCVESCESL